MTEERGRNDPHDRNASLRRSLEAAALQASGEVGYRRLTVQLILDRAEVSRPRFYRTFANKDVCYSNAYCLAADRLASELLAAGDAETGWEASFRAALESLADFVVTEPDFARGMLVEVHVAGGPAMAKRKKVFERLSRAIDRARRETAEPHQSPPPVTAPFILGAIEEAVVRALVRGTPEEFESVVADLALLGTTLYFGENPDLGGHPAAT